MVAPLLHAIQQGDIKALARSISMAENETDGYEQLMTSLPVTNKKIIGITGAPGTGKSSLADALIAEIVAQQKTVAVICVDPSSPFNYGALLGDRIRMTEWYNHPSVYIRSVASRGSLGGLHPKIIEITDIVKASPYEFIIVETVGVGQSEVEIAGLADTTVVVTVPEGGDEVQTMKAGVMEIADIFVVNKADRPGADTFIKNLRLMITPVFRAQKNDIPVIKTIATQKIGVKELFEQILVHQQLPNHEKKWQLLTEKAWQLIQQKRMKNIDKHSLRKAIEAEENFNLYLFVHDYES